MLTKTKNIIDENIIIAFFIYISWLFILKCNLTLKKELIRKLYTEIKIFPNIYRRRQTAQKFCPTQVILYGNRQYDTHRCAADCMAQHR